MAGVGVPSGLAGAGFGEVGEARANFNRMVKGRTRLKEVWEKVARDQLNVARYVKELSDVCSATRCMFKQEHIPPQYGWLSRGIINWLKPEPKPVMMTRPVAYAGVRRVRGIIFGSF